MRDTEKFDDVCYKIGRLFVEFAIYWDCKKDWGDEWIAGIYDSDNDNEGVNMRAEVKIDDTMIKRFKAMKEGGDG